MSHLLMTLRIIIFYIFIPGGFILLGSKNSALQDKQQSYLYLLGSC